jgi:1-deoxy-D-xylulose-5-phosphate synthase
LINKPIATKEASMILEKILSPADIKTLNFSQLTQLAKEVRTRIINVTSRNGGHVAPSMGTVELTIAILKIFDLPKDKIVWDVGHQSYAWKILTGRNDKFDTIRTLNGLSGFTNRDESEYDAFTTGHSSTSISAALGMACGRDQQHQSGHCIAVIGDGALTGGISFEALNHAGHLQNNRFIVILNDNEMSISKNVGGLQKYMARMLASRSYNSLKKQIWDISHSLPNRIRRPFIYGAQKLEESMINILVPNILFEDLGFKYVGPIDGHDMEQVTHMLKRIKENMIGPVLMHVVTKKGKGYIPAETNVSLFHGIGAYNAKSGKPASGSTETWSDAFGTILTRIADTNPKVVAITAAMSAGTGLSSFENKYPDRFYDVGIAEQHAITFAAGLAAGGAKPFVALYSTFLQRALDQVIHDVALPRLPIVICIDRCGLVGEDGATHQGVFDISMLNFVPNLTILAPATAEELEAMLEWASTYMDGPVAIRYPRGTVIHSKDKVESFTPATAEVIQEGDKLGLISVGDTLPMVSEIFHNLVAAGHQPWLINLRSIKPLDTSLIDTLAKNCKNIFTFETNSVLGGIGSCIKQHISTSHTKTFNYGYPDHFIAHGKVSELNALVGFTSETLTKDILKHLKK